MSPEVIGVLVTIFAVALTLFGGLFGGLRAMLRDSGAKINARFDKIEHKLDAVAEDVVDLKVAVARLEGPQPKLLSAR